MKNILLLAGFGLSVVCGCVEKTHPDRMVVVLSMDGFRWDYPDLYATPILDSLSREGVSATVYPCFPSNTFPNHYSMATGLHPASHGIVDNNFVDRATGLRFSLGNREMVETTSFWKGEPIWNSAELQGKRSFVYFWPGSETVINDRQASVWKKFDSSVSFQSRADTVLKWMAYPKAERPDLIMWYIEEPDAVGHHTLPGSVQTGEMVAAIDSLLGHFFARAKTLPYFDQIDFIVTADHGMGTLSKDRYINLYHHIDSTIIDYVTGSIPMQIRLKEESTEQIKALCQQINQMDHLQAWERGKLPEQFHYPADTMRMGHIIILPEIGYKLDYRPIDKPYDGGSHGFDPFHPDMNMVFYANGPSFKKGYRADKFQNLNLYALIAHLLRIEPVSNEGSIENVKGMLK